MFSKRMESSGRTEGERGVYVEKISNIFWREGSAKEGYCTRLCGREVLTEGLEPTRGGKSESVKREVSSVEGEGAVTRKGGEEG